MKFTKVFCKNFLSVGDNGISYVLDSPGVTLITGVNGAGKTVLCEAICFALFDQSYRKVNKPQLVNIANKKNCLVQVDFEAIGSNWTLIRGIAPNVFTITKDGKVLDQHASVREMQDWFEREVLKVNYNTFKQVNILGSTDYTPFMKLTGPQRREVSEQLLDLSVFTSMNKMLKEEASRATNELAQREFESSEALRTLSSLQSILGANAGVKEQELKSLVVQAKSCIEQRATVQKQADALVVPDVAALRQNYARLGSLVSSLETEVQFAKKRIQFFENHDQCPQCEQGLERVYVESILSPLKEDCNHKEGQLLSARTDLVLSVETINNAQQVQTQRAKLLEDIRVLTNQLGGIKDQATAVQSEIENIKVNSASGEQINEAKNRIELLKTTITGLTERKEVMAYSAKLLKDDGIKSALIKQFIPKLNKILNEYLQKFEFYVTFEFDENFEETISGGAIKQYSYNSFSMGQRQRIDLAMLFAWRELAQMRSDSESNILVFDEILDSSMDLEGADRLLSTLETMLGDTSTFIISHKEEFKDKIERHFSVSLVNGFTEVA